MAKKARNQSHTVSKIQIFFFLGGGGREHVHRLQ